MTDLSDERLDEIERHVVVNPYEAMVALKLDELLALVGEVRRLRLKKQPSKMLTARIVEVGVPKTLTDSFLCRRRALGLE